MKIILKTLCVLSIFSVVSCGKKEANDANHSNFMPSDCKFDKLNGSISRTQNLDYDIIYNFDEYIENDVDYALSFGAIFEIYNYGEDIVINDHIAEDTFTDMPAQVFEFVIVDKSDLWIKTTKESEKYGTYAFAKHLPTGIELFISPLAYKAINENSDDGNLVFVLLGYKNLPYHFVGVFWGDSSIKYIFEQKMPYKKQTPIFQKCSGREPLWKIH